MKKSSRLLAVTCIALLSFSISACGSKRKVNRTAADSTAGGDLSGYWNDIDANLVAQEMIKDCLSRPWLSKFKENGKNPTVKLYPIKKKTDDRNVNEKFFTKQVEKELLNSGSIEIVAASDEAGDGLAEKEYQAHTASDETVKSQGNETGADYILNGWVISQNETDGEGQSVRAYLTTMELIEVSTQKKAWIGEKKIRKVVDQAGSSW